MKAKKLCIIACAVAAAGIFFLCVNKPKTISPWKGYQILAVEKPVRAEEITDAFEKAGISVISNSNRAGIVFPSTAPVQPWDYQYVSQTAHYFSDKDDSYELFYLQTENLKGDRVASVMANLSYKWVNNAGGGYDPIPPVLFALFCAVLICLYPQKLYMCLSFFPFVVFCTFMPVFYAASACFFAAACFFSIKEYWCRKSSTLEILSNPPLLFFLGAFLFCLIAGGVRVLLSGIAACTVSISLLFISEYFKSVFFQYRTRQSEDHRIFRPVPLLPSRFISHKTADFLKMSVVLFSALFLLTAIQVFQSGFQRAQTKNGLSLPAPTRYTEKAPFIASGLTVFRQRRVADALVDFSDYICFQWLTRSYPYRPVFETQYSAHPGDAIDITRYAMTDSGAIASVRERVMSFDDDFIDVVVSETLSGPMSLEKMLAEQGRFVSVRYMSPRFTRDIPVFSRIFILTLPVVGILVYKGSKDGRIIQRKKRRAESTAFRSQIH